MHSRPLLMAHARGARGALAVAAAVALVMTLAGCSSSTGDTAPNDEGLGGGAGFPAPGGYSASGGYGGLGGGYPMPGLGGLAIGAGGGLNSDNSGGQFGMGGSASGSGGSDKSSGGAVPPGTGGIGGGGGTAGEAGAPASGGSVSSSGGAAGAGPTPGAGGDTSGDSDCAGGHALSTTGAGTPIKGYGEVNFQVPTSTQITEVKTTLTVPSNPTTSQTLFIWPGLEPLQGGMNFNPVGYGVLQPVLTWGTSCMPGSPRNPTGWWISSEYQNPSLTAQSPYGCFGGNVIYVEAGDVLHITMSLKGTVWSQAVTNRRSGEVASFDRDLGGQAQLWALFKIERPTQTMPTSDIVFTSTTLAFATASPMSCQPSQRGPNDYFATPMVSADGTKCCVSRIVLRAQGVPATTQDMP